MTETASISDALDDAFSDEVSSPEPEVESTPETPAQDASPEATDGAGDAPEGDGTPEATDEVEAAPEAQDDPEDAILSLSPEELAEIKSNPATAKLYKSLMKASTKKFQEISADKRFLDSIRTNPRAVLESAARNMGLELRDPQAAGTQANSEAVVDDVMQDMVNLFGPELAPAVRPVMERMVQNLVDRQVAPLREAHEQQTLQSYQKQAESYASTFRARHPNLSPEVEKKMLEIGQQISPNEGITPDQYLELLYSSATAGNTATNVAKRAAERIKAAQASAEPRRGAAPAKPTTGVTPEMSLDEAFDAAWAEAQRG